MKENVHTSKILDLIVSDDFSNVFIVMNYVNNDLKSVLKNTHEGLSQEVITAILFKLLCALSFIHKANVMHRDLKPSNILIDQDLTVLLCDFGLARTSRKVESEKKKYTREAMSEKLISVRAARHEHRREMSNHVMTRPYRAPEVIILEKKYKNSVDYWSTGCVLADMIFQQSAYRDIRKKIMCPLFNAKSCEPLSPGHQEDGPGKDLLQKILKIKGNLDEQDLSFVSDAVVVEQLLQSNIKNGRSKMDFQRTFPKTHEDIIFILQNMLEFNPYFRKKPEELI